jgi:uncharacterized protein YrrD
VLAFGRGIPKYAAVRRFVMLRTARQLEHCELRAPNGPAGHVTDLLLDPQRWTVRHLVVATGGWLEPHDVMVPVDAFRPGGNERRIETTMNADEIVHCPSAEPEAQSEGYAGSEYYDWPGYWGAPGFGDGFLIGLSGWPLPPAALDAARRRATSVDAEREHERSAHALTGRRIEANDGEIGHIDDFVVDDASWRIRAIVVDTRNWWPGKKVAVPPELIDEISPREGKIYVNLTRAAIANRPAFHLRAPLGLDQTDQLHAHHGWPRRSAEP